MQYLRVEANDLMSEVDDHLPSIEFELRKALKDTFDLLDSLRLRLQRKNYRSACLSYL